MDFDRLLLYYGYIPVFFASVLAAYAQPNLELPFALMFGGILWAELT